MQSEAGTVAEYLLELPVDRREVLASVRDVILANLPDGIVESMNWGMISYEVPLSTFADTYNGRPLVYAALASQRRHMSLYLMGIYGSEPLRTEFEAAYAASGRRMDMGRSCVRFRSLHDVPLDVVGTAIGALTLDAFLAMHDQASSLRRSRSTRRNRPARGVGASDNGTPSS